MLLLPLMMMKVFVALLVVEVSHYLFTSETDSGDHDKFLTRVLYKKKKTLASFRNTVKPFWLYYPVIVSRLFVRVFHSVSIYQINPPLPTQRFQPGTRSTPGNNNT